MNGHPVESSFSILFIIGIMKYGIATIKWTLG